MADRPSTRSLKTAQRLWRESVRPHAAGFGLAFAAMAVVSVAVVAQSYVLKEIIDRVFIARDPAALVLVAIAVFGIISLRAGAGYLSETMLTSIGQRIIGDTQKRLFGHLMHQDMAQVHGGHSGTMVSHLTFDVSVMRDVVSTAFVAIARDSLQVVGLIAFLFWIDWRLSVITLVVAPLALYPVQVIAKRMRRVAASVQGEMGDLTRALTQAFQSLRVIKAFGMEDAEIARMSARIDRLTRLNISSMRIAAASQPVIDLAGAAAIAAVLYYIGGQVIEGAKTAGDFAAYMAAVASAFQPLRTLSRVVPTIAQGLTAAERIFAVIDRKPVIVSKPDPKIVSRISGGIEFDGVHFGYEPDKPVLTDLKFQAKPGQLTALVGPSGAGKSTIFNLIPRFFDPDQGQVRVNGIELRDAEIASLRDCIGLVAQDVALFDVSILENIRYGRPSASDEDIYAAARAAAAHDFISSLSHGYDTMIGERGLNLSGGQRQRIAIARAILKDAPILLLDEATSALDSESERQIQDALGTLTRGRTTLVIAHRLSTVRDADMIHVFDQGRVVASGTHDELLAQGGLYARLHALQFTDPVATEPGEPA